MADYIDRPWGEARADMRSAKAAFDVVTKRQARQVKLKDFMLDVDAKDEDAPEKKEAAAEAWAKALTKARENAAARRKPAAKPKAK